MRRLAIIISAFLLGSASLLAQTSRRSVQGDTRDGYWRGDVNGDGLVTIVDLTLLSKILTGKTQTVTASDVNGDNAVNLTDITELVNIILGRSSAVWVEKKYDYIPYTPDQEESDSPPVKAEFPY